MPDVDSVKNTSSGRRHTRMSSVASETKGKEVHETNELEQRMRNAQSAMTGSDWKIKGSEDGHENDLSSLQANWIDANQHF
jgi:hypothetical protein